MKKVIAIILAVVMVFAITACKEKEPTENGMTGISNPMLQLSSLEELNEKIGCNLLGPSVMGKSDIAYVFIKGKPEVCEYDFLVNNYAFSLRAAKDLDTDISGVYIDGPAFTGKASTEVSYASTDTLKLARVAIGDYQYSLVVEDKGDYDQDQFKGIAEEIFENIKG